jgi:hypothetical protein
VTGCPWRASAKARIRHPRHRPPHRHARPPGRHRRALLLGPFDTVPLKGIDPLVQLGTLEALLTGRDYELIVAGPRAGHALAIRNGGARVVVTLTVELQAALAEADDKQLESAALPWCRPTSSGAR